MYTTGNKFYTKSQAVDRFGVDRRNYDYRYREHRRSRLPLDPEFWSPKLPKEKEKKSKRFISWVKDCYRRWKGYKRCWKCRERERILKEYFLEDLCKECCEKKYEKDKAWFRRSQNRCFICKTQRESCCC